MTNPDLAAPIVGFGSADYRVTRDGWVFSYRTRHPKMLGGSPMKYGHTTVKLYTDDGTRIRYVHDIVLETFVGPRPEGMEARHLNGKADDNRVENLAWSTHQVNMQDTLIHGTNQNAIKTHCKRGHEFTEANTYRFGPDKRWRSCRTCVRERLTAVA